MRIGQSLNFLMMLTLGIATNAAQAADITINIVAEVAVVDDIDNVLGGSIQVGDVITGKYTYDSTTEDTNTAPTVGDYRHNTPPYGIMVNAGGFVFETDPNNVDFLVEIVNDHGNPASDNYLLRSYNNLPLTNEAIVEHISWQLDDDTTTAISSDALTTEPPDLDAWESIFGLSIEGCNPDEFGFCFDGRFFIRAHVISAQIESFEFTCEGVEATIVGTEGNDMIIGTPDSDVIVGLGGGDEISGKGGDDLICGGPGKDILKGGNGDDELHGNGGRDTLSGGNGDDLLFGDANDDVLKGGDGSDELHGGGGADELKGGDLPDVLFGGRGDDTLKGGNGDDRLFGRTGDDILSGGDGDDLLNGGADTDDCFGGTGDDTLRACE